ncbi:MAG TPA: acyl-CoA dehydrogenase family protein [Rhodoglobus sp.]|nr:acyl-CoA dehydrogenase family protein [Rhodoglobus sp.]HPM51865.1 acyl-CoA dehydrogenase family protein [Rhodoglobus sp.]HPU02709.1 acyl-CoA dehydrogenase family protein [Rhodoglobus sp.]HQA22233.1 acyl-CoA dehydrogenase family protein [Rhodoglobus sp.]HQE45662.1 acyl-CoA dehydrogenase family protein [Rhodoglobus sp.]
MTSGTSNGTGAEALLGLDGLLTDDQRAWRDRARAVASVIAETIDDDAETQTFRREYVGLLAEAGLIGMHLSGYGCAGADAISYGLACYELEAVDTAWRTFVSVQGSLAMSAIHHFGSEEQKQRWLPLMARGEALGCFALTEPDGGSDPGSMSTSARQADDGTGWIIDGTKRWIGLASVADVAVVWARTPEGIRGFLVDTTDPGFSASDIPTKLALRASIQCDVVLESVRGELLPGTTGLSSALACLTEARYGIVWGVMGAARASLDEAIERATTREVFGAPIGSKQLVQQRLADAFVEYEKAMLLALHLGALKQAKTLTPEQVSVGKLNNVREAIGIAHAAREILAGDGVTTEFSVMRHLANLEAVRTYEGTDDIHTLVIGRALTGLSAF